MEGGGGGSGSASGTYIYRPIVWDGLAPGADLGGGALPARPPVQSHNDKGGGGGLFPVDLSVQTANIPDSV